MVSLKVSLDRIPVLLKGGSIIPRRQRIRRAASLMNKDPFTLLVALDEQEQAQGSLYLDDGSSFDYRQGHYVYSELSYKSGILSGSISKHSNEADIKKLGNRVERVILVGLKAKPQSITVLGKKLTYKIEELKKGNLYKVIIKDPKVWIGRDWSIEVK